MGGMDDLEAVLGKTEPSKDQLARLSEMAESAGDTARQIAEIEDALKAMKADFREITKKISEAMAEVGMETFKTATGLSISIKEVVSGTLPKDEDEKAAALALIRGYGAEDIIKHLIKAELGRASTETAHAIRAYFQDLGVAVDISEGIHPQTLAAFVRERLKNGEPVDADALGVYIGRVAKITLPKGA